MFLLRHFLKRLRRDGAKSLSVPLVAFVLVLLINLLGAVRTELQDEYDDMMENFPILTRLSDHSGMNINQLNITESFVNIFADPAHPLSLYEFTSNLALRRSLEVIEIAGEGVYGEVGEEVSIIGEAGVFEVGAEIETGGMPMPGDVSDDSATIKILGITDISALYPKTESPDFIITFFEGYDESLFRSDEPRFVVSEYLFAKAVDNYLDVSFRSLNPAVPVVSLLSTVYATLDIVGIVSGVYENFIIGPFRAVTAMGNESDDLASYSELLHMTVANNSDLSRLKSMASNSFAQVRPVLSSFRFAMTIYDSAFIEMLEPLRQNIILVDVATPFIFIISVAVGFLTSTLLIRQRMSEYAIMRSVGVRRFGIFFGALLEQALLSAIGAALGFSAVMLTWDYVSFERPGIFLLCYVLGAVFSASKAAGTDVMAILRNRE